MILVPLNITKIIITDVCACVQYEEYFRKEKDCSIPFNEPIAESWKLNFEQMDNLYNRSNFELEEKNKSYHHSLKKRFKIAKSS